MLTDEELAHLENDFIAFLIVNGVHAEEWEAINKNTPEKALKLVELFSDQVLEHVYSKVEYLTLSNENTFSIFYVNNEEAYMYAIQKREGSMFNLSTKDSLIDAINNEIKNLDVYTSSKRIENKPLEIHKLVSQGAEVSNHELWHALEKLFGTLK